MKEAALSDTNEAVQNKKGTGLIMNNGQYIQNTGYNSDGGGNGIPPVAPFIYDPTEDRKHFRMLFISLAALMAINLTLQYGLSYIITRFFPAFAQGKFYVWFLSIIPLYVFAFPVYLYLMKKFVPAGKIVKEKFSPGKLLALFLICIPIMYIGNLVGTVINNLIYFITGNEVTNAIAEILENTPWWVNFVATVIIAPIGEEFICRKLIVDRVAPKYGTYLAVIVSGLSFGLIHGNFSQFFYATGLGMFFAYIYSRTGQIWYTVGMHMGINFLGGIVSSFIVKEAKLFTIVDKLQGIDTTDTEAFLKFITEYSTEFIILFVYLAVIGVLFIGGIISFIMLINKRKISVGEEPIPKGNGMRFKTVFCNVGCLCFAVICLFMFVMSILQ